MDATDSKAVIGGEVDGVFVDGECSLAELRPGIHKDRKAQRVRVSLGAGLRQRGASGVPVRITDLSTHGFRIETHLQVYAGTKFWVRLPGLESSPATVVWATGFCVGCTFDRPLHPAVLDLVVNRQGAANS